MRNAFSAEITELARTRDDVVLLSGDIGNRLFDKFKEVAGNRFFNCGVAEANMIGVAAGLAMSGLRPVAYTITPFITTRCLEQIKIDVCYHDVPVVIVGTGSGLSYASLGATHHSCEDIAIMRVLPNMQVVCPADTYEVKLALRAALQSDHPVYIRIGKKGEPLVHAAEPEFAIGKSISVRDGSDLCILSTGNMVPTAVQCADELRNHGVSARVVSFHTVKPLDELELLECFYDFPVVVTMEEHSIIGGLAGAIAEWRSRHFGAAAELLSFGVADEFLHEAGGQMHARQHFGLTPEQMIPRILTLLSEKGKVFR